MAWHRSHCCHARCHCHTGSTIVGFIILIPLVLVASVVIAVVQFVAAVGRTTIAVGGSFLGFIAGYATEIGAAVVVATIAGAAYWTVRRVRAVRGRSRLDARVRAFAETASPSEAEAEAIATAGDALEPLSPELLLEFEAVYRHQVAVVVADHVVRDDERRRLDLLRRVCRLSHADAARAETEAFLQVYAATIADGKVTREEELRLDALRYGLVVSDTAIKDELTNLWRLCESGASMRAELQAAQEILFGPLEPIAAPTTVKLQRDEVCFFTAAFTEKHDPRDADRPLVDGASGTLHVTNKRLILVTDRARSIARDELLDVKVDPETRLLALIVEGQRHPQYLKAAEPFVLAAYLDRMRDLAAMRSSAALLEYAD